MIRLLAFVFISLSVKMIANAKCAHDKNNRYNNKIYRNEVAQLDHCSCLYIVVQHGHCGGR